MYPVESFIVSVVRRYTTASFKYNIFYYLTLREKMSWNYWFYVGKRRISIT